jgi:hypothetical protein
MADNAAVDLALTTERPALPEVVLVLAACAVVFTILVHFDGAAARDEAERARAELARRVQAVVTKPAERRPAGAGIGDSGPISVPVGSAWSPGTAPAVAHAQPARDGRSGPPAAVLAVMAAIGALMAAAGSVLLIRAR